MQSKIDTDEPSYSITDARPSVFMALIYLLAFNPPPGIMCFQVITISTASAKIVDVWFVIVTVG